MNHSFAGVQAMRSNKGDLMMNFGTMLDACGISYEERRDVKEIGDLLSQNCDDFVHDITLRVPRLDFKTADYLEAYFTEDNTISDITDWLAEIILQADDFEDGCKVSECKNIGNSETLIKLHFIDSTNRPNEELKSSLDLCLNEPAKDEGQEGSVSPHYSLDLVLYYLSIADLLRAEGVCRPLRDEVRANAALWQHFKIDSLLCVNMNDERLTWLTDRAQGSLRSLDLSNCFKVTNNGLRHVLKCNPKLTKLDLVGCRKVKVEDLLQDLKGFNAENLPGIKYLRVGELSDLTNQHVKELQRLLEVNDGTKVENYVPRYHFYDQLYLSLDDERSLDVETCPKCEKPKQVFDCPLPSCKEKARSNDECRGCFRCIARCICCGCCLADQPYEETFNFHFCCMDCYAYPLPIEKQEDHENGDEDGG